MKTTVYTPDSVINRGWRIWTDMASELKNSTGIIWRLMIRDLSAKYRQSLLGWVWAVIIPVLNALVFTVLRKKVISIADTPVPYMVYVFWGTTLWQLFSQSIVSASQSLVVGVNLVTKVYVPKETVVFASFGSAWVDFLIRCALSFILFIVFRVDIKAGIMLIPVVILPFFLFCAGIGLILGMLNSLFRDIASAISMITAFLMLLTPGVVYPPSLAYPMSLLHRCNPVSVFITAGQELVATGSISQPVLFVCMSMVCAGIFLISWYIFHVSEPRIVERI